MMRTTPLRLMTLHFGQMGLTEARTFMASSYGLPGVEDARVSTQGPSSVTAMVCSKCADIERSLVTAVHLSSRTSTSGAPAFTMGSTAMTRPCFRRLPLPGDLGWAVQNYAEMRGYSVVRQFVGHGTGKQ